MFTFKAGDKEYDAEVSFYTGQLYESEFGGDLIKDFFGVQDFDGAAKLVDGSVVQIDFTKINWQAATKVLWAAVKTADEMAASYTEWLKETSGANMWLIREQLANEISECFFRAETTDEEAD